jgi:hypothetical protein
MEQLCFRKVGLPIGEGSGEGSSTFAKGADRPSTASNGLSLREANRVTARLISGLPVIQE